ncbi:TIGR03619 family F420-dependent LLM class oxidoreductase (plasmid) [Streptomyces sp. NBC_01387]|uniref:TIGR03619 family F420-dependent LLM class oxidoreductase n=1 Tax=unclassified Streptomyces TaxID=2593676 RepID=UPI002024C722|nr:MULTISPECIES: TIGR03619 family F420-dependent LLM class oxidoreductase [unclassified Streptomyces]MCX4554478.1 TIGR03619 family F420-dependent LLM class oxidoreductase [Streptomyces sp. NBC_01500]WSC25138.1 TIGR03619 family F420-dependent LLM class oxidoreductase [Streptomyces sp. NBC_01766]WSV58981.1 TIGR03619 family F420-dependent LLM class oxidoreductase [Streptomyces sp. NBC_01014]
MSTTAPRALGVGVPLSGAWATPSTQVRIARQAEELGYQSLWTFTRLLFPMQSNDAEWSSDFQPAFHYGVAEPLITLGYLAGCTERIRLGVSVLNAPFFAPAVLAKQLIQLDRVSGGRLDAGLAQGWSEEEFRAVGLPMERRVARTLEYVEVLRRMWEQDQAEFQGEFTELPRTLVRPRPVQPVFPLLLGGSTEKAWTRAGRLAQGWVSPGFVAVPEVAAAASGVRAAAERAGRSPDGLRIVVRATVFLGTEPGSGRSLFHGSVAQIRSDIEQMHDAGATEVFLDFNFDPRIVGPRADPAGSLALVEEALGELAPVALPAAR